MQGVKDFLRNIMTDETRAMIVAFFPDLLSLYVAFGGEITDDQSRWIMSGLTKLIVLVFYLYKAGQNQGESGKTIAQQKKGK